MKWKLPKFGAEPKKLAVLVGLLAVAGYFYFSNRDSGATVSATPGTAASSSASPVRVTPRPAGRARNMEAVSNSTPREFRPTVPKSVDPSGVDPTLRLEELAALRQVAIEGGTRSLFELSSAPPAEVSLKDPTPIKPKPIMVGPVAPPPPPGPPPDPKAPPIPLKFYGFVNQSKGGGDKRAFFLDGEDIVIATEGDTIKKRYKIIRIGVNSATVEDTQFKSNNQQTLPLEAEMNG
jgi:hypothetical protein